MADIIDFEAKKKEKELQVEIEFESETRGQTLIELGIVALWFMMGGNKIRKFIDSEHYHVLFLQFSDLCFQQMEEENIVVDEDGNVGISSELKKVMLDAIKELENDLAADYNRVD